ncbi:hypothetical protein EYC98_12120 [Halieaceae bacterium IMCC14734]|uniref:Uncharacterized protein n=1 Tax=Candidatus Litorirhabdus singularis TaxID=2518993 RepID=A0ABT3TH63_9GAMM|nr:hypothetical protein [Candidatus Litorirhabdus singularis]MCX2981609.1 hypothetical protein [Candidatus Litorirhabdus singularis]
MHLSRISAALRRVLTIIASASVLLTTLASADDAPRTAAGKPDLNGVWQVLNRANFNLEPHGPKAALAMREGPVVPVPAKELVALGAVGAVPAGLGVVDGGAIPYTDAARQQRDENAANWLTRDPEIKCYLPGVPRATYMPFPFQIYHNQDVLVFSYEYAGAVRNIALSDPGPAPIDSWMGQSWAEWDGDTLVVHTEGLNGQSWLDRAGNFASAGAKITERFTRTSAHTLHYEVTIEDSSVYQRPWKMSMPLYKRVGRDDQLLQFNCVEFVEELMYGHLRKEPLD